MFGELLTNWEYDDVRLMNPYQRWLLSINPLQSPPEMIPFDVFIEKKFGKLIKKHLCQAVEFGACNPKKDSTKTCKPGTYYLKYPKILFFERTACARDTVNFDVILSAPVFEEASIGIRSGGFRSQWFRVRCRFLIDIETLFFLDTMVYNRNDRMPGIMHTEFLVPYLTKNDLEEEAERIAEAFFPELYHGKAHMDAEVIAKRLGLKVYYRRFTQDGSEVGKLILGRWPVTVFTSDGQMRTEYFDSPCILIDRVACYHSLKRITFAILHECSHFIEHWTCYRFQRFLNENAFDTEFPGISKEVDDTTVKEQVRWMERQADNLAARIQMPRSCILSELQDLVRRSRKTGRSLEMGDVITSLVRRFNTSKTCTEIRLRELGFPDINSIYHYVDSCLIEGKEICKPKAPCHEDYIIRACQLQHVLPDKEFQDKLRSGNYLYIDQRLCLNEPLYIRSENGKKHLTEYALLHPEECCVRFGRNPGRDDNDFQTGYFTKKNTGLKGNPSFPENPSPEIAHMARILDILNDLPCSAGETLSLHMKKAGVTIEKLVDLTGISDRTIKRYRKGSPMKLNNLVAICVALHLDPMFSEDLLKKAGFSLNVRILEHAYYEFILNHMYENDVPGCNHFLVDSGLPSLTSLMEALVCA